MLAGRVCCCGAVGRGGAAAGLAGARLGPAPPLDRGMFDICWRGVFVEKVLYSGDWSVESGSCDVGVSGDGKSAVEV